MAKPLIKGKVKVVSLKTKGGKALYEAIERTHGSFVTVGITEPNLTYPNGATLGQVAAWMEFGTHTKAGDEIVPERSFIRATVDRKFGAISKLKDATMKALMAGHIDLHTALSTIGFRIVEMMRDTIMRRMTVGNDSLAPATLARKRALGQPDIPLVATRLLIDHIGFQVQVSPHAKPIAGGESSGEGHH